MKRRAWILSAAGLLAAAGVAWGGDRPASRRAFAFLELGAGPRAYALGEAFAGLADDLTALTWNPAALSQLADPQLTFMHNQWILNLKQEYLAGSHPLAGGTGAIHLSYLNADSQLVRDADGLLTGESFTPYSVYGGAAYALALGAGVSAGAAVVYAREQLDDTVYQTTCLDLGAYVRPAGAWWSLGAAAQHVGFDVAGYPLPLTLRAGAAARLWDDVLNLTVEAARTVPGWFRYGVGAEVWVQNLFAFRAGYLWRPEFEGLGALSGLRAGLGFNIQGYQLDYAFIPLGDLGTGHRASLTYFFGGGRALASEKAALIRRAREQGQAALAAGRFAEAVNHFQRVLSFAPADAEAAAGLATAQTGLRKQELQQEIQQRLQRAAQFRGSGRLEDAIEEYQRILLMEPEQPEALRELAEVQTTFHAVAIAQHLSRGREAFRKRQWADALLAWQAVLSIDESHPEAKRMLEKTREEMAKGGKGFKDPRIQEWYLQGLKWFEQGDYRSATVQWGKVLKQAPTHAQAKRYLEQALHLIEEKVTKLLSAGETYYQAGDWVRAAGSWRTVFRYVPKQAEARRRLQEQAEAFRQKAKELYLKGIEAYTRGQWHAAIANWQDALTLVPDYPGAEDNIGKAREKIKAVRDPSPPGR